MPSPSFLGLPLELRTAIYQECLKDWTGRVYMTTFVVNTRHFQRTLYHSDGGYLPTLKLDDDDDEASYSLLYVCRQTSREVAPLVNERQHLVGTCNGRAYIDKYCECEHLDTLQFFHLSFKDHDFSLFASKLQTVSFSTALVGEWLWGIPYYTTFGRFRMTEMFPSVNTFIMFDDDSCDYGPLSCSWEADTEEKREERRIEAKEDILGGFREDLDLPIWLDIYEASRRFTFIYQLFTYTEEVMLLTFRPSSEPECQVLPAEQALVPGHCIPEDDDEYEPPCDHEDEYDDTQDDDKCFPGCLCVHCDDD